MTAIDSFSTRMKVPREPAHVHVQKNSSEAKFWIGMEIELERSAGFDAKTLRKLARLVEDNKEMIEEKWNDYFGD